MAVDVGDGQEAYPVRLDTLKKLERVTNRVLREHNRNGPAQPHEFPLIWVLKGKLDNDLLEGGTVQVSLWEPNASGDEFDTTNNIVEAYDWMLEADMQLPSGAKVVLAHIGKRWYVIASGHCPEAQP